MWVRFSITVFESLYVRYVAVSAQSKSKSSTTMRCLLEIPKYKSKGLKYELFSKLCIMISFSSIWPCLVFRVLLVVPALW